VRNSSGPLGDGRLGREPERNRFDEVESLGLGPHRRQHCLNPIIDVEGYVGSDHQSPKVGVGRVKHNIVVVEAKRFWNDRARHNETNAFTARTPSLADGAALNSADTCGAPCC